MDPTSVDNDDKSVPSTNDGGTNSAKDGGGCGGKDSNNVNDKPIMKGNEEAASNLTASSRKRKAQTNDEVKDTQVSDKDGSNNGDNCEDDTGASTTKKSKGTASADNISATVPPAAASTTDALAPTAEGHTKANNDRKSKPITSTKTSLSKIISARTIEANAAAAVAAARVAKHVPIVDQNIIEPPIISFRNGGVGGGCATVEFPLSNIQQYLICNLCLGYYKDPHTLTDCLHTFCKSCLFYSIACGCHECPTCKVYIGKDPLKVSILDHSLQELIDRIILPKEMITNELHEETTFYENRKIRLKPEYTTKLHEQEGSSDDRDKPTGGATTSPTNSSSRRHKSSSTGGVGGSSSLSSPTSEKSTKLRKSQQDHHGSTISDDTVDDTLEFTLMPEIVSNYHHNSTDRSFWTGGGGLSSLPPLDRPCLRVSGKMRMYQLKKYLLQKLNLTTTLTNSNTNNDDDDNIGATPPLVMSSSSIPPQPMSTNMTMTNDDTNNTNNHDSSAVRTILQLYSLWSFFVYNITKPLL